MNWEDEAKAALDVLIADMEANFMHGESTREWLQGIIDRSTSEGVISPKKAKGE